MNGIYVTFDQKKFLIINVYLPYERSNFECVYLDYLARINAIIQTEETTSVIIVGDFNADISKHSTFGSILRQFVNENNYVLADELILPDASYTFVSPAWGTVSWLDHIVCSHDMFGSLKDISLLDDVVGSDHKALLCEIECDELPTVNDNTFKCVVKNVVDWKKISTDLIVRYKHRCNEKVNCINIPTCSIECRNMTCKNEQHLNDIDILYNAIINCLNDSSNEVLMQKSMTKPVVHGWNYIVKEHHTAARDVYKLWVSIGRPRCGTIFNEMKRTKAQFKYSLRRCRANSDQFKADAIARELSLNDYNTFWKKIKNMNNAKLPLADCVDGVSGESKIVQMWKDHYKQLFNSVPSVPEMNDEGELRNMSFRPITNDDVKEVVDKLSINKSSGLDGLTAEHLKYAGESIFHLLTLLINCIVIHGYIPAKMIETVLVPVIKDKTAKSSSKDNYRPIALCNIVSKALEMIILNKIEVFLYTNYNQFGFKKGHSTEQAIFTLKEVLHYYKTKGTTMFTCFLDASKAFDRVNHTSLFKKLKQRGCPEMYVRLLRFWYCHQYCYVRWGDYVSDSFRVCNGVRQGGILSPYLFNIYVDELSDRLNSYPIGAYVGMFSNHIMYADDLVLYAPTAKGLQKLIDVCSEYGLYNDIIFNPLKSCTLRVNSTSDREINMPPFVLNGVSIPCKTSVKYLGYILDNMLNDDDAINKQKCALHLRVNMLKRRFNRCSWEVKLILFKSYCTQFYCNALWTKSKVSSLHDFIVSYNNSLRCLMNIPYFCSAKQMFSFLSIPSAMEVIGKSIFRLMKCCTESTNPLVNSVLSSSAWRLSCTRNVWYNRLYSIYM